MLQQKQWDVISTALLVKDSTLYLREPIHGKGEEGRVGKNEMPIRYRSMFKCAPESEDIVTCGDRIPRRVFREEDVVSSGERSSRRAGER